VQNEKRQRANDPYGLVEYAYLQGLFPKEHPYHPLARGIDGGPERRDLGDVRTWFRTHYGPNNAVLVLAGDIDVRTARPLVEHYFSDVKRGPTPPSAPPAFPTVA
jgi:predicted Zn-dependent peptidase